MFGWVNLVQSGGYAEMLILGTGNQIFLKTAWRNIVFYSNNCTYFDKYIIHVWNSPLDMNDSSSRGF